MPEPFRDIRRLFQECNRLFWEGKRVHQMLWVMQEEGDMSRIVTNQEKTGHLVDSLSLPKQSVTFLE